MPHRVAATKKYAAIQSICRLEMPEESENSSGAEGVIVGRQGNTGEQQHGQFPAAANDTRGGVTASQTPAIVLCEAGAGPGIWR